MEMLPITAERKARLDDYAKRHGLDAGTALDEVLANHLEWEKADYDNTVEAALEGYEDVKAGRTQPAAEVPGRIAFGVWPSALKYPVELKATPGLS